MSDWTIILRSLRARLFSTVTTIITVAVAVALMLVLLVLHDASRRAFSRGSGDMHLLISGDQSPLVAVLNGIFYANAPRRPLPWSEYERLARSFPLDYAVPTQYGDSYLGLPVLATTTEFFSKFKPNPGEAWSLREGRFFEKPFEVVVGSAAARATGLRIGETIFLTHGTPQSRQLGDPAAAAPHVHYEFAYTVVGILSPTGGSHDRALFTDLTSSWIIHAHDRRKRENPAITTTTADDLIDADRLITGIYLRVATRPGQDATALLPVVFDRLRREASLTVAQPEQEISRLRTILGSLNSIFVAIAAAVMLSSAVAIMLALYNSMEQRRRQIAVLRVLGASQMRIFGLIVTESGVLGIAGAIAGVVVALIGSGLGATVLRDQLGVVIDPTLPPRETIAVALATLALAVVAGVVPGVMAYRTSVARSLRPMV